MEGRKKTMSTRKRSELLPTFLAGGALLWMTGCSVGPNYKRPAVAVPAYFGNVAQAEAPASPDSNNSSSNTAALGDENWWEVFKDKDLQELIRTALKKNYDVRIAATRVLQAQAQLGITRADQLPTLDVGGNVTSTRNPQTVLVSFRTLLGTLRICLPGAVPRQH